MLLQLQLLLSRAHQDSEILTAHEGRTRTDSESERLGHEQSFHLAPGREQRPTVSGIASWVPGTAVIIAAGPAHARFMPDLCWIHASQSNLLIMQSLCKYNFIYAKLFKGGGSPQLYYHDCSGTTSQVTPQGCHC